MAEKELNNKLNEIDGLPGSGFVGSGTAVENGKNAASGAAGAVSTDGATVGGMESFTNGGKQYMDWINGQGPYGPMGRDHTFALSSLAIVNPYAAGAILGFMGAGAAVYGIATSAYVRARNAQKRLRNIYDGVIGGGYPLEFAGWGILGIRSKKGEKLGITQFSDRIKTAVDAAEEKIKSNNLDGKNIKATLSDSKDRQKMEMLVTQILEHSYSKLYIPQPVIDSTRETEKLIVQSITKHGISGKDAYSYLANKKEKTYDEVIKSLATKSINTPLYVQKWEYMNKINSAGKDVIEDYKTKMGFALKKGGNRARAALNKLINLWDKLYNTIDVKMESSIEEMLSSKWYSEYKMDIDSLYSYSKKVSLNDMLEDIGKFYVGGIWVYQKDTHGKNSVPVWCRIVDTDIDTVTMMVINSNISGTPYSFTVNISDMDDTIHWRRMKENENFGVPDESMVGKWCRLNYEPKKMDTVVYVTNYDASSGTFSYIYANTILPQVNWGQVQRKKLRGGHLLSVLVEYDSSRKNESVENSFSNVINESSEIGDINEKKIFKLKSKSVDKDSSLNKDTSIKDSSVKDTSVNSNYDNNSSNDSDVKFNYNGYCKQIKEFSFVDEGCYCLIKDNGRIVKTLPPMFGEVGIIGEDAVKIEVWAKWDPVELPDMEEAYDNRDKILDFNVALSNSDSYSGKIETYGDFGNIYLDGRYEQLVQKMVLDKHVGELSSYAVDSKYNYYGLYNIDEYSGKCETTISNFKWFRKYIVDCIGNDEYPKDNSSNNESTIYSYKDYLNECVIGSSISKLFEAGAKSSNGGSATNVTQKTEVGTNKQTINANTNSGDRTSTSAKAEIGGDNNGNMYTISGGFVEFIPVTNNVVNNFIIQNYGIVNAGGNAGNNQGGVTPGGNNQGNQGNNNQGNAGNNQGGVTPGGNNQGNQGNNRDDYSEDKKKFNAISEIPSFIPTICKEVIKVIDSFYNMSLRGFENGSERKSNTYHTAKKDRTVEVFKDVTPQEISVDSSISINPEEWVLDDDEVLIYFKDVEDKNDKEFEITFYCNDKWYKGTFIKKNMPYWNLMPAIKKDSDDVKLAMETISGFSNFGYYSVNSESYKKKIESKNGGSTDSGKNESIIDPLEEYYNNFKLFEDNYNLNEDDDKNDNGDDSAVKFDYNILCLMDYDNRKLKFVNYDFSNSLERNYKKLTIDDIDKIKGVNVVDFDMYKAPKLKKHEFAGFGDFVDASGNGFSKGTYLINDESYYTNVLSHLYEHEMNEQNIGVVDIINDSDNDIPSIVVKINGVESNIPYIFVKSSAFVKVDMNTLKSKFKKDKLYSIDSSSLMDKKYKSLIEYVIKETQIQDVSSKLNSVIFKLTENISEKYELNFKIVEYNFNRMLFGGKSKKVETDNNIILNLFKINTDDFHETESNSDSEKTVNFDELKVNDAFTVSKQEFESNKSDFVKEGASYAYFKAMRLYEDGEEKKQDNNGNDSSNNNSVGNSDELIKFVITNKTDNEIRVKDSSDVSYVISKEFFEKLKTVKKVENNINSEIKDAICKNVYVGENIYASLQELWKCAIAMEKGGDSDASILNGLYTQCVGKNVNMTYQKLYDIINGILPKERGNVLLYRNPDEKDSSISGEITYDKSSGIYSVKSNDGKELKIKSNNAVLLSESLNEDSDALNNYIELIKSQLYGKKLNESLLFKSFDEVKNIVNLLVGNNNQNSLLNLIKNKCKELGISGNTNDNQAEKDKKFGEMVKTNQGENDKKFGEAITGGSSTEPTEKMAVKQYMKKV